MSTAPRTTLGRSLALLIGSACASSSVLTSSLQPPASAAELGLAAYALQDTSHGPFFPRGQLSEAVQIIRRIRRENPATREVAAPAPVRDEESAGATVTFELSDSLSRTLCGTDSLPPLKSIERWLNPPRMGVARFDSITDALGGAKAIQIITSLRRCYVKVHYVQLLNVPGVERAYATLRPAIALPWFHYFRMGDGDDVRIEASDSVWRVRISAGWGDCPSGCIHRHVWEFKYYRASGRIDKVVDSGPPLPPRQLRIIGGSA
jgi:hypothetical protein